jgi:hypothetical protein
MLNVLVGPSSRRSNSGVDAGTFIVEARTRRGITPRGIERTLERRSARGWHKLPSVPIIYFLFLQTLRQLRIRAISRVRRRYGRRREALRALLDGLHGGVLRGFNGLVHLGYTRHKGHVVHGGASWPQGEDVRRCGHGLVHDVEVGLELIDVLPLHPWACRVLDVDWSVVVLFFRRA